MEKQKYNAVRIIAPEWYERADFCNFVNRQAKNSGNFPATWHRPNRQGLVNPEWADVFTVVQPAGAPGDEDEGCDRDIIPADIWKAIVKAIRAEFPEHQIDQTIVWISGV